MENKKIFNIEKVVFTLAVAIALAGAVHIAAEWEIRASIIILSLGTVGLMLVLFQILSDIGWIRKSNNQGGMSFEIPASQSATRWGNVEIWCWLIGFYAAINLIGFPVSVPLFVFAYSKAYGSRWFVSLSLAGAAWIFLYGVFEKILHVPWPEPLLF